MISNIQISVLVVLLLCLCISSIESQSFSLVSNYIRCTESTTGSVPSDETFKRRLVEYDTLDKAMLFYRKIFTEYNSTTGSNLRTCMNDQYSDGNLFLRQDFFNSFRKVVRDVKAPYKLLSVNDMDSFVIFLQYLQEMHPFYLDFVLKYEHSIVMLFYYKETTPCAKLILTDNVKTIPMPKSNLIKSLRYEANCPFVDLDSGSPQQIENYIKCVLEEMSTICVKPALKYFATIFAADYPQIIKGDLYSYASSLTNKFPDNRSSRSSFASVYLIMFLVALFSYVYVF